MRELQLHPNVTFFVGENGSGKSTLLEAIAVAYGFNAEGGSKNFNFATETTHSPIIMAYPHARIYNVDNNFELINYTETEHYEVMKNFMNNTDGMLRILLDYNY